MTDDANVIDHKAEEEAAKDVKRERMLEFIRDVLIERAHGLRTGFEANSFLYCQSKEGKEHLKRLIAMEAAADIFTHLVGQWQSANERHPRPDWLKTIAQQAMATFIEAFR
jgi:hypothetical protein